MKNLLFLLCFCTFLLSSGRRGGGHRRSGGGFDGVDESLLDPTSFLPMESIRNLEISDLAMRRASLFNSIRKRVKETHYGTKFQVKENISEKAFGLGIGPGFFGAAGIGLDKPNFGAMAGLVSYSVYHRYVLYKRLLYKNQIREDLQDYEKHYDRNTCIGGCPENSECLYGICECKMLYGYIPMWGKCTKNKNEEPVEGNFAHSLPCETHSMCLEIDKNLICSKNGENTSQGANGTCNCRTDTRWNQKLLECQMFQDVDCSAVTYSTPPSQAVLNALEKNPSTVYIGDQPQAKELVDIIMKRMREAKTDPDSAIQLANDKKHCKWYRGPDVNYMAPPSRAETKEENFCTSLLAYLESHRKEELLEAFCRDIDAYSAVFKIHDTPGTSPCPLIPTDACAMVFDSHDCSGGWSLQINKGDQRRFKYWSSDWKYRNDIDTVGVRSGCTLTGFSGTSFEGSSISVTAGLTDRWVVLGNDPHYKHMDQNIESLQCVCRFF